LSEVYKLENPRRERQRIPGS